VELVRRLVEARKLVVLYTLDGKVQPAVKPALQLDV